MMQLAALNIYPIKSCAGIALHRSRITQTGLAWDRHWMLVDANGRFVTQRELPQLATVVPQLLDSELVVSAPDESPLRVPLEFNGEPQSVRVWRDTVSALDCGDHAAIWFSRVAGRPLRLVAFDPRAKRLSNTEFTADASGYAQFADGYAVLVVSEESLVDLNTRLPEGGLPMTRFRPNLVLRGARAYQEDTLKTLRFGDVELRLVKACTRCVITTIDQRTGMVQGDQPLRTLRGYRYDPQLKGVTFGQNAIVMAGADQNISVGMTATFT